MRLGPFCYAWASYLILYIDGVETVNVVETFRRNHKKIDELASID